MREFTALEAPDNPLDDGACVTCLNEGNLKFPLDFRYHRFVSGHVPVFTEAGRKVLADNGFTVQTNYLLAGEAK